MPGDITGYKYTPAEESFWGSGKKAKISFKGSNSKTITFELRDDGYSRRQIKGLFELIDKYSTKINPEITPAEVIKIRTEFAKSYEPLHGGAGTGIDYYKGLSFLLDTFTSEDSEGGKNITTKEIALMFETFKEWNL